MKVTIENNELVIRAPIGELTLSSSGKSYIVAQTPGRFYKTEAVLKDRPVTISLMAFVPKDKPTDKPATKANSFDLSALD